MSLLTGKRPDEQITKSSFALITHRRPINRMLRVDSARCIQMAGKETAFRDRFARKRTRAAGKRHGRMDMASMSGGHRKEKLYLKLHHVCPSAQRRRGRGLRYTRKVARQQQQQQQQRQQQQRNADASLERRNVTSKWGGLIPAVDVAVAVFTMIASFTTTSTPLQIAPS
ncbi:hypothetical protein DM02DRAFT_664730 [Periconia macrospinosa]|uniref:Uncharacterized protein n=1 Tax=Periconia macrospinosa TaxID=97972 RepID=A0A2V1CZH7_9PLEO|nr:hypothetical protein DM02DRAFT_664730 [Periconia macrospinosa]